MFANKYFNSENFDIKHKRRDVRLGD